MVRPINALSTISCRVETATLPMEQLSNLHPQNSRLSTLMEHQTPLLFPRPRGNRERQRTIAHYLPPLPTLHVREQQLEAITQRAHIGVHVLLQLKGIGHDFDGPVLHLRVLARFEAEVEVARVFRVDAEVVDGAFGVGFRVGG